MTYHMYSIFARLFDSPFHMLGCFSSQCNAFDEYSSTVAKLVHVVSQPDYTIYMTAFHGVQGTWTVQRGLRGTPDRTS